MSDHTALRDELVMLAQDARDLVGEFVYAPFGLETSNLVNSFTLGALFVVSVAVLYRAVRPAPQVRHRAPTAYDYGRNL